MPKILKDFSDEVDDGYVINRKKKHNTPLLSNNQEIVASQDRFTVAREKSFILQIIMKSYALVTSQS